MCDENGVVGFVCASTDGVPVVSHVGVDVAGESLDESHLLFLLDFVVARLPVEVHFVPERMAILSGSSFRHKEPFVVDRSDDVELPFL